MRFLPKNDDWWWVLFPIGLATLLIGLGGLFLPTGWAGPAVLMGAGLATFGFKKGM